MFSHCLNPPCYQTYKSDSKGWHIRHNHDPAEREGNHKSNSCEVSELSVVAVLDCEWSRLQASRWIRWTTRWTTRRIRWITRWDQVDPTSGSPLDHSQSDMDTTPVNDVREAFEEHGVGRQYFFRGSCAKNAGKACLLSLSAARRQIRWTRREQIISSNF